MLQKNKNKKKFHVESRELLCVIANHMNFLPSRAAKSLDEDAGETYFFFRWNSTDDDDDEWGRKGGGFYLYIKILNYINWSYERCVKMFISERARREATNGLQSRFNHTVLRALLECVLSARLKTRYGWDFELNNHSLLMLGRASEWEITTSWMVNLFNHQLLWNFFWTSGSTHTWDMG